MNATERPRAVISHSRTDLGLAAARRLELALRGAGFEVGMLAHPVSLQSSDRLPHLRALYQVPVVVLVITRVYLLQPECRDVIRLGRARQADEGLLLVPVVIEAIDEADLGDDSALLAGRTVCQSEGLRAGFLPDVDKADEVARGLMRSVIARGLWKPAPGGEAPLGAGPRPSAVAPQSEPSRKDVFISYATEDAEIAEAVCAGLENSGIGCWIAPRDILPGTRYGKAIMEGISASRIVVLVYSAHSNSSDDVINEVELAKSRRVLVIQFRIEDVPLSADLEYYLRAPQWLDALGPPLERHIAALEDAVRAQLAQLGAASAEAGSPHAYVSEPPGPAVTDAGVRPAPVEPPPEESQPGGSVGPSAGPEAVR